MAKVLVTMKRDMIVDGVLCEAGETVSLKGTSAAVVLKRGVGVKAPAPEDIAAPVEDVWVPVEAALVVEEPEPEEKPAPRRRSRKAKDEGAEDAGGPEAEDAKPEDATEPEDSDGGGGE